MTYKEYIKICNLIRQYTNTDYSLMTFQKIDKTNIATLINKIRIMYEESKKQELQQTKLLLDDNEAEVLENYLTRKTMRLEESGLHDSRCCLAMNAILYKLHKGASHGKN